MAPGVQIIMPGLCDLPLDELDPGFLRDQLPALNRILGRATPRSNQDYSIDAMLSRALSVDPEASAGLALASAFGRDGDRPERLMLVEAIHLQADMQGAIAFPIAKDPEGVDSINIIIKDLQSIFKVDCDITPIVGGHYLLRLKGFDPPTHYPHPLSVLGKSIKPFIEQSRQVLPWYRLINEIQMFMHQHPQNAARLRQGRLPINSLWAWGAGPPPLPAARPAWYGDDPLLNRFAESLQLPVASCSSLAHCADLDHALIVDLRLLQLLKSGGNTRLDDLLLDIERQLLVPVLQVLKRRPAALMLRAGYRVDFELRPSARYKFWRRPGNLQDWRNQ